MGRGELEKHGPVLPTAYLAHVYFDRTEQRHRERGNGSNAEDLCGRLALTNSVPVTEWMAAGRRGLQTAAATARRSHQ